MSTSLEYNRLCRGVALVAVLAVPALAWSYEKPVPDFQAGDPIRAQDVNDTIDDIYAALNELDGRVSHIGAAEVINTGGPLPVQGDVTTAGGSQAILFVSGSAFRDAFGTIVLDVLVDGEVVADVAVLANETGSHKAVVSAAVTLPGLPAGDHTISLAINPDVADFTGTDANDFYRVTLLELP